MILRRLAAALLALTPAPALAQAWQCHVPGSVAAPAPPAPDGPRIASPVTGYTLALSWSPEYCHGHGRDPKSRLQCSGKMGRFGFILHGLWPEARGHYPQWCATRRALSPETLRRNLCLTPSPELMAHEWAKHGACMARSPEGYLRAGRALFDSLSFPDMSHLSRTEGLDAGKVRAALVAETPFLKASMIRLKLSRTGWLQEVHICYSRRFLPERCPGGNGVPDSVPVKIWRSFR